MKTIKFTKIKALDEQVKFLENSLPESEWANLYEVVLTKEGAEIHLTDVAVAFLREEDHCCTAGPEDGCGFCAHLYELDLLPEADYDVFDFESGDK